MRIARLKIEKFRSIRSAEVRLGDITAFVGENNAGKTAALRAINAVLNFEQEEEAFRLRRHQHAPRSNTRITLTLSDIPESEVYEPYLEGGQIVVAFSYIYSTGRHSYRIEQAHQFVAAPDDVLAAIRTDLRYVYIPAERTNQDICIGEGALFAELIERHFAEQVKNRDTVSSGVKRISEKVHRSVLEKLETQMNALYPQDRSVRFSIDFPAALDYHVLLSSIQISLGEGDSSYPMQEWGSGTKSLAIIAMHRANALMDDMSIILGIEEPETNLHPQAQRRFLNSLREGKNEKEMQVLFTTHSTVLVDELGHEDVILVRRESDEKRGFRTKISQLPEDFWDKYGLNGFKHYQFFRYRNSDFFFSRFVVVGESKNDVQVFQKLVDDDLGGRALDVSFLNAEGVGNLKFPYFLLKELEIPSAFVVDRDFLFDYLHSELMNSRDKKTGLPIYKQVLRSGNAIIEDVFPTEVARLEVEQAHAGGYRKLFDVLCRKSILVMNYSLDADLTCSAKARDECFRRLKMPQDEHTQRDLLVSRNKAIKSVEFILEILDVIPKTSYPESYLKIKRALVDSIRQTL